MLQDWRSRAGCSLESWRRGDDVLASDSTGDLWAEVSPSLMYVSVCLRLFVYVFAVLQEQAEHRCVGFPRVPAFPGQGICPESTLDALSSVQLL